MSDELRQILYPLGFLSSLAFTSRFLMQWISSEVQQKSHVTFSFWWLSFIGNMALMTHSAIQLQYPVCVIQALNAVISLRNLNLMQPQSHHFRFFPTVFSLAALALLLPTLCFYLFSSDEWLRIPTHFFSTQKGETVPLYWHLIGFSGVLLYASRFWLQWYNAERTSKSSLDTPFWWLSLIGASFSLLYFLKIQDIVNLMGPLIGLVPYLRNLILLKRRRAYE